MNVQTSRSRLPLLAESLPPLPVILALIATYLVWGSTYLVTRFTIESIPPFMLTGIRCAIAGAILLAMGWFRGQTLPTKVQLGNALFVGALMFGGGAGLTAFSEIWVESGLTATAIAATPIWAAIFAGIFGKWPNRIEWIGLGVGLSGIILLNFDSGMSGNPIGAVALIIGPMLWAFGSMWSRRVAMPVGMMGTGLQLGGGAFALIFISRFAGENMTALPTTTAWLGLVYLTLLSSVITFSAYMYLVRNVRPVIATSYAYVNPILAILLGVYLAGETITAIGVVAMFVILAGVGLLAMGSERKKSQVKTNTTPV
jgi:drug/metabolite transporter (DMT)-like permease